MERMKSQHLYHKNSYKLKDYFSKSNLPIINSYYSTDKQNTPVQIKSPLNLRILKKNTAKALNKPIRFVKNNNKIQNNKSQLNNTSVQFFSTNIKLTSDSLNLTKNNQQQQNIINKKKSKTLLHQEQEKQNRLTPKTLNGIIQNIKKKYQTKIQQNRKTMNQSLQNPKIQIKINKKKNSFQSRFTLLELKSYYCSILNLSKGNFKKFRYALQNMLNLANITVRQNILNQSLKELFQNGISFPNFVQLFTQIQQKLRKQTIIDYFQILLSEIQSVAFKYEDLLAIFEGRMKRQHAEQLIDLLYERLKKTQDQTITKKQIYTLCYEDEQFCTRFYVFYQQNLNKGTTKNQQEF